MPVLRRPLQNSRTYFRSCHTALPRRTNRLGQYRHRLSKLQYPQGEPDARYMRHSPPKKAAPPFFERTPKSRQKIPPQFFTRKLGGFFILGQRAWGSLILNNPGQFGPGTNDPANLQNCASKKTGPTHGRLKKSVLHDTHPDTVSKMHPLQVNKFLSVFNYYISCLLLFLCDILS